MYRENDAWIFPGTAIGGGLKQNSGRGVSEIGSSVDDQSSSPNGGATDPFNFDQPPTITGPTNVSYGENQSFTFDTLIQGHDSDGFVAYYTFYDSTPGTGYLTLNGARITGASVTVAASDLHRVGYFTGSSSGSNQIAIDAIDNQGVSSADFLMTINVNGDQPPTITGPTNVSYGENQSFTFDTLIHGHDSDGFVAYYTFYDTTPGAGYLTLDGSRITGTSVTVTASDLHRVGYFTGSSSGSNQIAIDAIDNQGVSSADFLMTINVNGDQPPTITGPTNLSYGENQSFTFDTLIQGHDSDGFVAYYTFYDSTPGAGYLTLDGVKISGTSVTVTASDLHRVGYFTGSSSGSNQIVIDAIDNQDVSSADFLMTINVNGDQPPMITGPTNVSYAENQSFTFDTLIQGHDTDGFVAYYTFYDSTPGAGYLTLDGVKISGTSVTVTASDLHRVGYFTGLNGGSNQIVIDAIDNQGVSSPDFLMTVNVSSDQPPTITGPTSVSYVQNQSFTFDTLMQGHDSDGSVASYSFYDSTPGAGYLTLDGVKISGTLVTVSSADLHRVGYFTGPDAGANQIVIDAIDNQGVSSADFLMTINVSAGTTDLVREDVNTSYALPTGQTVNGTIDQYDISGDSTDHDWYQVTLVAGHSYHFSALAQSGTLDAVAIDLRDASGSRLTSVYDAINPGFDFSPTQSGTYFLAVSAGGTGDFTSKTGDYQIGLTDNGVAGYSISPSMENVSEGAGSFTFIITRTDASQAVTVYASTVTGSAHGYADNNHDYGSDAGYNGVLNQAIHFNVGETTETVTILINDDSLQEPSETFGFIIQSTNTDGNVDDYLAKSGFTILDNDTISNGPDDYADDASDTTAPIGFIGVGSAVTGFIGAPDSDDTYGDKDVFQVQLLAGHTYSFELASDALDSQALPLGIFTIRDGANFDDVLETSAIGSVVTQEFTADANGFYYVRVGTGGAATDEGGYILSLSDITPTSPSDDYPDYPGDTTAQNGIPTIAINGSLTGVIEAVGDKDVFAMSVVAGDTYQVSLSGELVAGSSVALHDVYATARDGSDFNKVLAQNGGTYQTTFSFVAEETGTEYLRVGSGGDGDSVGGYSIAISEIPAIVAPNTPDPTQGSPYEAAEAWLQNMAHVLEGRAFGYILSENAWDALSIIMLRMQQFDATTLVNQVSTDLAPLRIAIDGAKLIADVDGAANPVRELVVDLANILAGELVEQFGVTGGTFVGGIVGTAAGGIGGPLGALAGGVLGDIGGGVFYDHYLQDFVRNTVGTWYDNAALGDAKHGPNDDGTITIDESQLVYFDSTWYLNTYADAALAVANGTAGSAYEHFLAVGIDKGYQPNASQSLTRDDLPFSILDNSALALGNSALLTHPLGQYAGDGISAPEQAVTEALNAERPSGHVLALDSELSAIANRKAVDLIANNAQSAAALAGQNEDSGWAQQWSNGNALAQQFAGSFETVLGADGLSNFKMFVAAAPGTDAADVLAKLAGQTGEASALADAQYDTIGLAEFGGVWVVIIAERDPGYSVQASGSDTATTITQYGGPNDDLIYAGSRAGALNGEDGNDIIVGGVHDDVVAGGGGNDTIILSSGGNDTVSGGDGADIIGMGAALTRDDHIDGGADNDTVNLDGDYSAGIVFAPTTMINVEQLSLAAGHSYKLTTDDATVAAGQTLTVDGSALGANDILTFNGSAETDGQFVVNGGAAADTLTGGRGDDVVNGNAGDDTLILTNGGNDKVTGGDGNDSMNFGAALTAADRIDGGAGSDLVYLNGDYSSGLAFSTFTMINVERLGFAAGHSYSIKTNDATVAAGQTLTVNGGSLGTNDSLYFNGSAETDGQFSATGGAGTDTLIGGTGNDTMTGNAGDDTLNLSSGGNDSASGGDGNDTINAGGALTAADRIDGGSGTDLLYLSGNYSVGLVFAAATMINIEKLGIAAGYSYNLTTNDANLAAGQVLTVNGTSLGASDALVFDGSHETDGGFALNGGAGADVLAGGSGNDFVSGNAGDDILNLTLGGNDTAIGGDGNDNINAGGTLTAADRIDGGTGSDLVYLNGDYSAGLTFAAATMINVERLGMAAGHNYNLTTDDGTVGAGQTLSVNGSALGANDVLVFNGSAETDGQFIIDGGVGADALTGGHGNDTIDGNDGADIIDLISGGEDTVSGGGGDDTVDAGGALTSADHIDGGDGRDTVALSGDYSAGVTFASATMVNVEVLLLGGGHSYELTTDDATVGAGQVLTVDGSSLTAGDMLIFDGSAETNGQFVVEGGTGTDTIIGGAGNDTIEGNAGDDTIDLSQGGTDTAAGGDGNDVIDLGAALTADDRIDGGGGSDTVFLDGDYSTAVLFSPSTIVNVESIALAADHSYSLETDDATVAAGQTFAVDGSALGTGDTLTFDGSAETDGAFNLNGGAGADHLVGGGGNDVMNGNGGTDILNVSTGGNDTVNGGDGDDLIEVGGALTAGDRIDGGAGTDTVVLDGDYSAGLVFSATSMMNVETLTLVAGDSYDLTTNEATVAADVVLTVDGSALTANDSLIFDGSAETDGSFLVLGGAGADTLIGGSGNDTISGNSGNDTIDLSLGGDDIVQGGDGDDSIGLRATLTAADRIDGGNGNDTIYLNGDYSSALVFTATTMTNVEALVLATGNTYNLTTDDATVAAGRTLTIDGSALGLTDALVFDGSAETDGSFVLIGGAGADILIGGAGNDTVNGNDGDDTLDLSVGGDDTVQAGDGNDTIKFGSELTASDQIDGGAGFDTLLLDGDYSSGLVFSATTMANVEALVLAAGHTYRLTTDDANVAAGQMLKVDGSALGASDSLFFNGSMEEDGWFYIIGGAGHDFLRGGAGNDTFDLSLGGADTARGGAGDDKFYMGDGFSADDRIDGGTGDDTVFVDGDYSSGVVFRQHTLVGVENLVLANGHDYKLTTSKGTVVSGETMTVNASALGQNDRLIFDGSAEKHGAFNIVGGAGNDVLTGGGGNDVFDVSEGGRDRVSAGLGDDLIVLGASLGLGDRVDGGKGYDTVVLSGDYSGGFSFGHHTMTGVEYLKLAAGFTYDLTSGDDTVASGETLTIDASSLGPESSLTFDGWGEKDGHFVMLSGLGADVFTGGRLSDTFVFESAADSTGGLYDTIRRLDFGVDKLDISTSVMGIDAALITGALDSGSEFNSELHRDLKGHLSPNEAILFTANEGSLAGETFLIVDLNGVAGYQAGQDLVICVTGEKGDLSVADFI